LGALPALHQAAALQNVSEGSNGSHGSWAITRLRKLSNADKRRDESKVLSGFGKNVSNWIGRDRAYPTNVLHLATECSNRSHSAAFPKTLPAWFIQLFTEKNDLVFDPFMGSGTTALACIDLGRRYLGIELQQKYLDMAKEAVAASQLNLNREARKSARPDLDRAV
jgi:site-specific DNA-methyltransferase (adenine-specific)